MSVYFFDSSALAKRYFKETGSGWVLTTTDPSSKNTIYIARITGVEVASAIARQAKGGLLSSADASALQSKFKVHLSSEYFHIEIHTALLMEAMAIAEKYALRGYDAVQLAASLELYNQRSLLGLTPFTFVSSDKELNTAAAAEGLAVDNPIEYP